MIGGGVIGTSIAYQLAKASVRVVVLDRGRIGGEATGASAGIVLGHPAADTAESFSILLKESARLFPALAVELSDRTGMDIGLRRSGLVRVAFDETQEQALRSERHWQLGTGVAVAWLDSRSALDVEPALSPLIRAGIYYADGHHLLPRSLATALARAASDLGATVREGAAIDRLLIAHDRVTGVGIGSETISASEVVIANGAWASSFSDQLGIPIPVRPVRGQLAAIRTIGTALRTVVMSIDGYVLTRADGQTIVGSTIEDVGFQAHPTLAGVADLLSLAQRLAPSLASAPFASAWAGLRPSTPDGLPLIGRVAQYAGVTIAGGHFRDGILLAPITGEVVADLLLRRRPRLPLDPFDPARFIIRAA